MNPIQRYIKLRNEGLSHKEAEEHSDWSFTKSLGMAIFWVVFFLIIIKYISSDDKGQDQYVRSLEKVVASCLDGKSLVIGNKVYLCSTYDTGERI